MSFTLRLKKTHDVSKLEVINAIVAAEPDVSFINIDEPYMLLGIKDKSLRGVVVQENEDDWEVMVPSTASLADYTLYHAVVKAIATSFDMPLLLPASVVMEDFGDEDDEDSDDLDEYSEDFISFDDAAALGKKYPGDGMDEEDTYDEDEDEDEDEEDEDEEEYSDGNFDDEDFGNSEDLIEVPFPESEDILFPEDWGKYTVHRELGLLRALVCFTGTQAVSQGLFHSFCIGPWLLTEFNIPIEPLAPEETASAKEITEFAEMIRHATPELAVGAMPESLSLFSTSLTSLFLTDEELENGLKLLQYLAHTQWRYSDCADTTTEMRAVNPAMHPEVLKGHFHNNEEENPSSFSKSISAFSSARLAEGAFPLLISYADTAAVTRSDITDSSDTLLIPFETLHRFMPGKRIDDMQFVIESPLSEEEINDVIGSVPVFVPRDIFFQPEWPGFGNPDKQNTYIMMWNPEISSFTLEDFRHGLAHIRTAEFNWSIHERGEARIGDRFFLVCCGGEHKGMVASGLLGSNPYLSDDWSGKGREVWYVDLIPNVMVDPVDGQPLSLDELILTLPDFDWRGGHSGRLLSKPDARTLNHTWRQHLLGWMQYLSRRSPAGLPMVNIIFR